ncbi:MAG: DUF2299 family protein [Candidatus Thermoplasmatota archaeon]
MKEKITEWLDEENREYEVKDHSDLNWLIHLKHGNRVVLLGNPEKNEKRLEVVYKLNISDEHKQVLQKLNDKQRGGFEKKLVMILAKNTNIYNIQRDEKNIPESVIIKRHLFEGDLKKTLLYDTVQNVINLGMRTTIHFQSLGGSEMKEEKVSTTKTGQSIYR